MVLSSTTTYYYHYYNCMYNSTVIWVKETQISKYTTVTYAMLLPLTLMLSNNHYNYNYYINTLVKFDNMSQFRLEYLLSYTRLFTLYTDFDCDIIMLVIHCCIRLTSAV